MTSTAHSWNPLTRWLRKSYRSMDMSRKSTRLKNSSRNWTKFGNPIVTAFEWKTWFLCLYILPTSAETLIRWNNQLLWPNFYIIFGRKIIKRLLKLKKFRDLFWVIMLAYVYSLVNDDFVKNQCGHERERERTEYSNVLYTIKAHI